MPGIRIRLTGTSVFIHALLSKKARCVCGSLDVQVEPGAFGVLAAPLGFSRLWCRSCRRHFYLRTALAWDDAAAGEPLLVCSPRSADDRRVSTQALDPLDEALEVRADAPPTDLRALDRYVAQPRAQAGIERSTKRRKRGLPQATR